MGKRSPIPHGTTSGYARKCRCAECTEAQRIYMRAYYAKRKAEGRPMGRGRKRNKTFAGTCEHCGSEFRAEHQQPLCSRRCHMLRRNARLRGARSRELVHVGPVPEVVAPPTPVTVVTAPRWWNVLVYGPCVWCEEPFTGIGSQSQYCSKRCRRLAIAARRGEFVVKPRFRYAIYQRDDWTCQICRGPVDRAAAPLSDWRASLDHIVPRSKGGDDSWDNLRLAHRWCNAVRGAEDYHSDLFEAVTTSGPLRIGSGWRPAEDAA